MQTLTFLSVYFSFYSLTSLPLSISFSITKLSKYLLKIVSNVYSFDGFMNAPKTVLVAFIYILLVTHKSTALFSSLTTVHNTIKYFCSSACAADSVKIGLHSTFSPCQITHSNQSLLTPQRRLRRSPNALCNRSIFTARGKGVLERSTSDIIQTFLSWSSPTSR